MIDETEIAQPLEPLPPMATQFERMLSSLANTDDAAERQRLARQLGGQITRLIGQTADNALVATLSTEEWVRQQIGSTNDMISQLAADSRALLTHMQQLLDLGQDTQARMAALENAQGLMAGHLSTLTEAITDLADRYTGLDRRVGRAEQRINNLADRVDRLEAALRPAPRGTDEPGRG